MYVDDIDKGKRYKTYKEIEKEDKAFADYKVKCKCSHTVIITSRADRVMCTHCGQWIYKDDKAKMKYKLKELLK